MNNNIEVQPKNNDFIKEEDLWTVIYSYFKDLPEDKENKLPFKKNYYLTNHHLDSYNDFILTKIPQTLKENNPQTIFLEREDNDSGKDYTYKYEIDLYYGGINGNKIYLGKPVISDNGRKKQMFPNEARLKNLTYSSDIFCDIDMVIRNNSLSKQEREIASESSKKTFSRMFLCSIPIMLHSKICVLHNHTFETLKSMGECPYEQGGYFIVDGAEKVIVSHERKAENKIYVQSVNDDKLSHTVNIKSVPVGKFKYPKTTEISINKKDNTMYLRLPGLNERIPLFIIFRALGYESDKEILELIFGDLEDSITQELINDMIPTIYDGNFLYDSLSCIKYMKQFTKGSSASEVVNIFNTELVPHIGSSYSSKAYFLGNMVKKLLYNKNKLISNTDRDSFAYKRVDLSGFLLAGLFRDSFIQFQRDIKLQIDTEYRFNESTYINDIDNIVNNANIRKIFSTVRFEKDILRAFKIGTILNKSGLIQSLSRRGISDIISHTRRINTPMPKDSRIPLGQRKLHPTQFGIICPIEAPDGGNVGIKKHMTIMAHITFGCDNKPIEKCLKQLGMRYLNEISNDELNLGKVFLNGNLLGIHYDMDKLNYVMKLFRRNGIINVFTSLNWDRRFNELYISTDGGRCCRPIPIVNDNKLLMTNEHITKLKLNLYDWDNFISGFDKKKSRLDYYNCDYDCKENIDTLIKSLEKTQGVIEYIDVDELDNCLVSASQDILRNTDPFETSYTHCELHPSVIFGHLGFIIPFPNHSQAPRNVYGAGQGKQAVGVYCSNYRNRMDSGAHVLNYPQKPLVNTRMSKYIMNADLPCGNNIIVALCSYSGYNQEDSVIINRKSLEKGLFNSTYYKVYESSEYRDKQKTSNTFYSHFEENEITPKKGYDYSKIDKFGIVKENVYVKEKDVLVAQYTENEEGINDDSLGVKKDAGGLVDKVYLFSTNSDNHRMCKIRLCSTRIPEIGDKFSSRHGQKGTIGIVMNGEDMPYSKDGIVPDMLVNPHAFPSRMTVGQFLESLGSKISTSLGFTFDGTAFQEQNIEELGNILEEKCNYSHTGDEILYSGRTGEQMNCKIFMGPTYYQRLKQMVQDKINSRARGPVTMRERQPPSGKAAGGGLRIGEMERDAIISHGLSQFLKESMMERSDGNENFVTISNHTGEFAAYNPKKNIYLSPSCDGPIEYSKNRYGDFELVNRNNKSFSFSRVNIPYTIQLLIQECEALGLQLRLNTGEKIDKIYPDLNKNSLEEKNTDK